MQRLRTRLRASASRGAPAALSLDFLTATGALDPRITFSRGSNATLVDATGKLTYAPNNLLENSESFQASTWTKAASGVGVAPVVTANVASSPIGTTTADRIQFSLGGGTTTSDWSSIYRTISIANATNHIYSVWLRSNDSNSYTILARDDLGSGATSVLWTVTPTWQRFSYVATSTSTTSNGLRLWLRGSLGTSATADILAWGAQLEAVTYQTTPGTYNPTTVKNLLGYTQEFDNAAWTKSNATVTANATTAPDGTLSADKLVETTAASSHYALQAATVAAAPYTFSTYAKAGERSFVSLAFDGLNAWFNLSTGAVGTVEAGLTASITAVGNGWYRCAIFRTVSVAGSKSSAIYPTNANNVVSYTGDGTSGIFIWGAQLSDSASLDPYVYNPAAATASTAYYGPRFDYDPVTLAAKGLLIEEARTNLLTYSEQFDNAAWTKTNSTVTANATASPDGTTNADRLIPSAFLSQHRVDFTTSAAAGTYAFSTYIKAAGYNFAWIRIGLNGGWVDLTNGSVSGVTAGYTLTSTPVGNGWYRLVLAGAAALNDTVRINAAQVNLISDFTGDGTSGIYLWGAQLEAGSFATSYIPTVASQVTRSADVATMIGDNFRSWYNQNAGTFVVEADTAIITGDRGIISANDGSGNNDIDLRASSSPTAVVASGGASQAILTVSGAVVGTPTKLALAYALNDFAAVRNGGTVAADTSGTTPAVNQMQIGNLIGSTLYNLNGHIRSLGYYNTRLPNATLQTLTNPSTTPSLALNFISDTYTVGA